MRIRVEVAQVAILIDKGVPRWWLWFIHSGKIPTHWELDPMRVVTFAAMLFASQTEAQPMPQAPETVQVKAQLVGWSPGKPPLNALRVDLTLTNPSGEDRWLVVPRSVYIPSQGPPTFNAYAVAFHPLRRGSGMAGVVDISGDSVSLHAMLLSPSATVTIQNLYLEAWGDFEPSTFQLEFISASAINLNGQPIRSKLHRDVHCHHGATGSYGRHDSQTGMKNSDYTTVPLTLTEIGRTVVRVKPGSLDAVRKRGAWVD